MEKTLTNSSRKPFAAKFGKGFKLTRKAFSLPYILFMLLFVITPLVMILANAFIADGKFTFQNFVTFFSESSSLIVLGNSLLIGVVTTLICLIIGYPCAYILSKMKHGKVLVYLFVLPMWVNFLIRTLATKAIFFAMGINLGLGTVLFGMVYNYLPFMILPLFTVISSIDKSYIEAAEDLGADKLTVFLKTILPLSLPGIISGITMVFIPTISTFAISQMLSNGTIFLFGDAIQMRFEQGLYGVGSIMSLVMLIFVVASNLILTKFNSHSTGRSIW